MHEAHPTKFPAMPMLLLAACVPLPNATSGPAAPDPRRFEDAIAAFEQQDRTTPPPEHPILFLGSSTITMWRTLRRDFPGRPVLNRGFGGSQISDILYFYDRVVRPYAPARIVFYCGDNDLAAGKSPERVVNDFRIFAERVTADLPKCRVCFISIKPSPSRWSLWRTFMEANLRIESYCRTSPRLDFLDVSARMLLPSGPPRPALFRRDGLHMTAKGYAIWRRLVNAYLDGRITGEAPVQWAAPWPAPDRPDCGFPAIAGARHTEVFHADPHIGTYNHGPRITFHEGWYIVAWYSHARDEDAPGQRVLFSVSRDGKRWSAAAPLFDSLSPVRRKGGKGIALWPAGYRAVGGRLYAFASIRRVPGRPDPAPLVRRLRNGRPDGPVFYLRPTPPPDLGSLAVSHDLDETTQADARVLEHWWRRRPPGRLPGAAERARLCEPAWFRRPDGTEVCLFRDDLYSLRLFASSRPNPEVPWPTARRTTIPDSPSKTAVGALPDGHIYLIGNMIPQQWRRDPLLIALSRDGIHFDRVFDIRHGAPTLRFKGANKGPGFQYPDAVVANGALWVAYSIGKEDIAVTRIPLEALRE